jgi:hypothetical protein
LCIGCRHGIHAQRQERTTDAADRLADLAAQIGIAEQAADAAADQASQRRAQQAAQETLRRQVAQLLLSLVLLILVHDISFCLWCWPAPPWRVRPRWKNLDREAGGLVLVFLVAPMP